MNMPRTPVSQNIRESDGLWGDVFCLDGECDKAQSGKSNDLPKPFLSWRHWPQQVRMLRR